MQSYIGKEMVILGKVIDLKPIIQMLLTEVETEHI